MSATKKTKEELEELEDIRMYDEAMLDTEQPMPIDIAFEIIEKARLQKGDANS